jgi:hypothetical protein
MGQILLTFGAITVFVVAWLCTRWYLIAHPSRALLLQQIKSVESRIQTIPDAQRAGPIVVSAIAAAQGLLTKAGESANAKSGDLRELLFWSSGGLIAGWRMVHEAERLLVAALPSEVLEDRLKLVTDELNSINSEVAKGVRKRTSEILLPSASSNSAGVLIAARKGANQPVDAKELETRLRDQLMESLRVLYSYRDTEFSKLITWQGKASWLIYVGLLLILLLAILSNPILLLLGAVGGLVSRVMRVVRGPDVPTDYGAFWTSLFASPLFGALAGWIGITFLFALNQLGLLGQSFASVKWDELALTARNMAGGSGGTQATGPFLIWAIAILFGFSERLLPNAASVLEGAFKPVQPEKSDK